MSDRFNDKGDDDALSGVTFLKLEHSAELGAKQAQTAHRLAQLPAEDAATPPHLRDGDATTQCGTCSFVDGSQCTKYNVPVELTQVCDRWNAKAVAATDDKSHATLAPWKQDGEPPLDGTGTTPGPYTENPSR